MSKKRNDKKKVIVIGAGVAGLSAGIYLRKLGYQAEIYEKNPIPGGECTGWDRQGYHIDNCIHWLIGSAPGTDLYDLYKETGIIDEKVGIHHSDVMYVSNQGKSTVTLYRDMEKTKQEFLSISPEDKEATEQLFKMIELGKSTTIPAGTPGEHMGAIEGLGLLWKSRKMFKLFAQCKGKDTKDLMDTFKSPVLKACLHDFCPKESGASSFPVSYGNFVNGDGGIPKGGSRAVAYRMMARFEELGGTFHGSSPVESITIKEGKAVSLLLQDGTTVQGDYFIPACDAGFTFSHLLPKESMDPVMSAYFGKPDVYPIYGMFQAAWAVDCPDDLLKDEQMLSIAPPPMEEIPYLNDRITLKTYGYEPSFAPKGKQIIQLLWGMDQKAWPFWQELNKDKTRYEETKQRLAKLVENRIGETWPEYKGKLTLLDTWTPCTYSRYCNAYHGYNQACIISKKNTFSPPYPSAYVKGISNVVLAGQWVSPPGGIPGSSITGKMAASRIDWMEHKKSKTFKRILMRYLLPTLVVVLLVMLF